jgi:hypothetical protein
LSWVWRRRFFSTRSWSAFASTSSRLLRLIKKPSSFSLTDAISAAAVLVYQVVFWKKPSGPMLYCCDVHPCSSDHLFTSEFSHPFSSSYVGLERRNQCTHAVLLWCTSLQF